MIARLITLCKCDQELELTRVCQSISLPIDPTADRIGYREYSPCDSIPDDIPFKQRIFYFTGIHEGKAIFQEAWSP